MLSGWKWPGGMDADEEGEDARRARRQVRHAGAVRDRTLLREHPARLLPPHDAAGGDGGAVVFEARGVFYL